MEYEYHTAVCKSIGMSTENLSKKYNTLIVMATKSFPNKVSEYLAEAVELIPTKPEPYLFLAFDQLHKTLLIADP